MSTHALSDVYHSSDIIDQFNLYIQDGKLPHSCLLTGNQVAPQIRAMQVIILKTASVFWPSVALNLTTVSKEIIQQ